MITKNVISEKEFLQKVADGVSKKIVWEKPFLLLFKDGDDYNYIVDMLSKAYKSRSIINEPTHYKFVRVGDKLEMSFEGAICNGHYPDVDIYKYLGGPLGYDEKIHRYCADLIEYESKPVISLICISDKNCSVKNIPAWMEDKFEIAMLKLDFSSFCDK